MTAVRRALVVLVVAVIALAAGYALSRFFYAADRRPDAPLIDLDNPPPVDASPTTVAPHDGATIIPPPTLAPAPTSPASSSPPPPAPTNPPPPPPPPPPPSDDDDDDDDDDVGELDD